MAIFAPIIFDDGGFQCNQASNSKINELSLLFGDKNSFFSPVVIAKERSLSTLKSAAEGFDQKPSYLIVPDDWSSFLQVIAACQLLIKIHPGSPVVCVSSLRPPSSPSNLRREILWNRKASQEGKVVEFTCEREKDIDTVSDFAFDYMKISHAIEAYAPGATYLVERSLSAVNTSEKDIRIPGLSHVKAKEEFRNFAVSGIVPLVDARYKQVHSGWYTPWSNHQKKMHY